MATHRHTARDPRGIITPDAFELSNELFGLPLAGPWRRFWALMVDLAVIGLVTAVTKSFALVLGVVAAAFFIRVGLKRTKVRGNVFGRAMRFSVGCLGVLIAVITAALWSAFGADFGGGDNGPPPQVNFDLDGTGGAVPATGDNLRSLLSGATMGIAFANAEDLDEARDAGRELIRDAEALGMGPDAIRELMTSLVPEDEPWAEALIDRLMAEASDEAGDATMSEEVALVQAEVAEYSTAEAMAAYVELRSRQDLSSGDPSGQDGSGEDLSGDEPSAEELGDAEPADAGLGDEDIARLAALQLRLSSEIAGDSLADLETRVAQLRRDRRVATARAESAEAQLVVAESRGFFSTLRQFVDELGFGFGWASLYLTVFLSWWNGQTVGKRLLGIRVVRLDGEPITWWVAFERAGGYAAGFATGLLGFAQIFWDSNRQAIHDRIVGTVVVIDGAKKVIDWESAL